VTGLRIFAACLFLLGLFARLRAVAFPDAEMFRSFPSEDGYLMLTVARNLALGRGLTSAAGTLPTNGVQPLATLLQAACFWLVGGDRAAAVRFLIVFSTAIAAATVFLVDRLGREVLGPGDGARAASRLGACVWFTSPLVLSHSMNMLETGLYTAAVVMVALLFARGHAAGSPWPWPRCLALGVLLGVSFWARNDAVFLMAAAGLAHLATAGGGTSLRRRLAEAAAMAVAAAAVSLPWLLYNLLRFGSIVPTSGYVHLRTGELAANLGAATVALFEQATLVASFEFDPVQHRGWFVAVCGLGLALIAARTALRRRTWDPRRGPVMLMASLFTAGLLAFYVPFFDAPYFLRRYLFPLSPFFALGWGALVFGLWTRLSASRARLALPLLASLLLGNFVLRDGLLVRGPWRGGPLFRNVDWVESHVSAETWVGAFQSGTLGFFHDRTINLDGKVNPEAMSAIRKRRHQAYVLESPIQFVVDWASILEPWWRSDPALGRHFQWVLRDPGDNFAVLGRRER